MTDSIEKTRDGKVFLFAVQHVLDAKFGEKVAIAFTFDCDGVPEDCLCQETIVCEIRLGNAGVGMRSAYDLGVVHETLGHYLGSPEFAPPDENVNVGAVLGKVYERERERCERQKGRGRCDKRTCSLLCSGITTADDGQRFVPKDGNGTVTNGACTDATLPIVVFALETQALRTGTGSDDDRIGRLGLLVFLTLTPVSERTGRKIETGDGFGDNRGTKPDGLGAELVHEFWTEDASRETGEIFNCIEMVRKKRDEKLMRVER